MRCDTMRKSRAGDQLLTDPRMGEVLCCIGDGGGWVSQVEEAGAWRQAHDGSTVNPETSRDNSARTIGPAAAPARR